VQGERLGSSDGQAHQLFQLAHASLTLAPEGTYPMVPHVTVDGVAWDFRSDLLDSTAEDRHFAVEPRLNAIRFGDGRLGLIPPEGVEITASYLYTLGKRGNVPAGTEFEIAIDSDLVIPIVQRAVNSGVSLSIHCEANAAGGTDPTDLEKARDEALSALRTRWRAITAGDFEELVLDQPGLNVARARCFPEWDLTAPDPYTARPGHASVIVVPCLDDKAEDDKPEMSPEAITDVWDFLNRRRLITCRHHVVSPHYTDVCVRAEVVCIPQVSMRDVEGRIITNLKEFFHPLTGGQERDGKGWPFGRDVYASEAYQVIEETEGVDHVESLTLYARDESGDWLEAGDRVAVDPINLVHFDVQSSNVSATASR
jgi:predicted phage baseplate assembly protein